MDSSKRLLTRKSSAELAFNISPAEGLKTVLGGLPRRRMLLDTHD